MPMTGFRKAARGLVAEAALRARLLLYSRGALLRHGLGARRAGGVHAVAIGMVLAAPAQLATDTALRVRGAGAPRRVWGGGP